MRNVAYSLPRKTKTATAKVGDVTQNIDLGYACFQEKYYRVCIAKAAVNETVCEDSHAEHVQFQCNCSRFYSV